MHAAFLSLSCETIVPSSILSVMYFAFRTLGSSDRFVVLPSFRGDVPNVNKFSASPRDICESHRYNLYSFGWVDARVANGNRL